MARERRVSAMSDDISAFDKMRKLLLSILAVAVIGTITWALWPATTWPRAFCQPINRVVGKDADAIVIYVAQHNLNYHDLVSTATPASMQDALVKDVVLALHHAPTAELRQELSHYAYELDESPTLLQTTDALGRFDGLGRTQLRACGITPVGK